MLPFQHCMFPDVGLGNISPVRPRSSTGHSGSDPCWVGRNKTGSPRPVFSYLLILDLGMDPKNPRAEKSSPFLHFALPKNIMRAKIQTRSGSGPTKPTHLWLDTIANTGKPSPPSTNQSWTNNCWLGLLCGLWGGSCREGAKVALLQCLQWWFHWNTALGAWEQYVFSGIRSR